MSGIRPEIKALNGGKELFYKNYARIEINTDDDLPFRQTIKISNTDNNFQMRPEKLCPQIYLDECLYEL